MHHASFFSEATLIEIGVYITGMNRKKGFIKGDALRLLRTNSVRENFEQSKRDLEQGYPYMLVQEILTEVMFTDRNEVLRKTNEILPFVTTYNIYNHATPNLIKILTKHCKIHHSTAS